MVRLARSGKILFDEFSKWAILKALDLEEDDNFDDAGETAKHDAVGYIEERGVKSPKIVTREPCAQPPHGTASLPS